MVELFCSIFGLELDYLSRVRCERREEVREYKNYYIVKPPIITPHPSLTNTFSSTSLTSRTGIILMSW